MMKRRWKTTLLGAGVLALAATAGCSLRYDFTECESDGDCVRFQPTEGPLRCEDHACVPASGCLPGEDCGDAGNEEDAAQDAGDLADSSTDTGPDPRTDTGADADAGPADGGDASSVDACDLNTDCDADSLCIDGACVPALSEDCESIEGPIDASKFVVLGSILPLSAPYDNIGPPLSQAIELAVNDFNREGGLPGGRRILWVSCDDHGNSTISQQAARHLVEDLKAPAIIGPLFSTPFTDVVLNLTRDAGVFTITPTATAPSLSTLDDHDLAWRTIASDVLQGNAIIDRVKALKAAGLVDSVTILAKDDAYGNGLYQQIQGPLNVALGNNNVVAIKYEDPAAFEPPFDAQLLQTEFQRVIGQASLQNAGADAVVLIGTTEAVALGGAYIQNIGPARLIFSHGAVPDMGSLVQATPTLQPLVEGVAPNIFHPTNFDIYKARFDVEFPGEPPLSISPLTYDAAAVTLLAMSTVAEGEPVTGAAIASAMTRLAVPSATPISYGSATWITDAISLLNIGSDIDLIGVSGDLDFDHDTGDLRTDFLGVETVKDDNNVYQLTPARLYALYPEPTNRGQWLDLCTPGAEPSVCGATRTCVPMNPSQGVCVEACDPSAPACSAGTTCVPLSPGAGLCLPECDSAATPPLCPNGTGCLDAPSTDFCSPSCDPSAATDTCQLLSPALACTPINVEEAVCAPAPP